MKSRREEGRRRRRKEDDGGIARKEDEKRRIGATLRNGAAVLVFMVCRLARQVAGVNRRNYIEEKLPRDNSD